MAYSAGPASAHHQAVDRRMSVSSLPNNGGRPESHVCDASRANECTISESMAQLNHNSPRPMNGQPTQPALETENYLRRLPAIPFLPISNNTHSFTTSLPRTYSSDIASYSLSYRPTTLPAVAGPPLVQPRFKHSVGYIVGSMPSPGRSSSNDIPQLSLDATRPLQPNTNLETSLSNTRLHSEEEHLDSTSLRSASEVASGSQSPRRDSSNNQSRQQTRLTERQRVKLGRRAGRVRATSNRPSSEKGSSPKRSKRELPRDTSDSSSGSKERSESWYRCSFTSQCKLQSPERKVVSHFFGRNKLCTRALPENLCVGYCRKHYQRTRYRNVSSFAILQLDLIKAQLDNIEQWGGAHDCEFTLRKRAMDAINVENAHQVACDAALRAGQKEPAPLEGPPCDARFLLSHLGKGKSFQQIRTIIAFIENHVKELQCPLPEFEILANIKDEFKPARKRAAK